MKPKRKEREGKGEKRERESLQRERERAYSVSLVHTFVTYFNCTWVSLKGLKLPSERHSHHLRHRKRGRRQRKGPLISLEEEKRRAEIMLRKRSRPVQNQSKDHLMLDPTSDSSIPSDAMAPSPKGRGTPFFSVPGLFVGLCTKGLSESETARSPTSPLDCRAFSPRSPGLEGHRRSWVCSRVGLGLVDSLNDETKPCGRVLGFSESKNILLGSQMRINNIPSPKTHLDGLRDDYPLPDVPKSLPKEMMIHYCQLGRSAMAREPGSGGEFEKIRSCSPEIGRSSLPLSRLMYRNLIKSNSETFSSNSENLQLEPPTLAGGGKNFDNFPGSLPISIGSSHGSMGSLSASEIELSEDYTCIISHGPNPKTIHIFGDCILESHEIQSPDYTNKNGEERRGSPWLLNCSEESPPPPSHDFLSLCFSCKKKLDGKDIYIYRGEKAFCSCECRDREILIEEEMEKPTTDYPGSSPGWL